MAKGNKIGADFCIEIDFDKGSEHPSRVFSTLSSLIDTFESIDNDLVASIDSKIETVLLLEDIESGSIKAWLSSKIKNIDDTALKSGDWKKIVGLYLVKAKWFIIKQLEGKVRITDIREIEELQEGLLSIAEETDVRHLPSYVPIEKTKLLKGVEGITQALSPLTEKDSATFVSADGSASFNLEFSYVLEEIEELIIKESESSELTMILKVKRPDYLGEAMWEFRHAKSPMLAKVLHIDWLQKFQDREIDVRPGDSLRVRIRQTLNYDYDHNLISTKYEVLEVLEVLRNSQSGQLDVFDG